ncbi:hypothetical protein G5C51_32540, partial [Streptomyces sp. A7024]|nr:hypothetical protein [Streptomyces coryli]
MAYARDLSTVIMCHPSRRAGAERILDECRPLAARIVEDPEPDGVPSPLRTAKVAWAAVADGASHHLVVQDDVHLRPGFAEHVHTLLERHPGCAVSLGVLWVSPYNSYRVRQAAIGGYPAVRLAPWEWVPSLGLALPADTARELADFLRGFPDVTRDDDEHIAVFCAERGIPVIAPVPHLLDHSTRPSVAGNDHHGVRLAVACVDEPVGTGYWTGPTLDDGVLASGLGYAVELTGSRCHLRIRRSGEREAAEQPFTWPWRPWSQLVGVAEDEITRAAIAAAAAEEPTAEPDSLAAENPPAGLPATLAAEVWAAGYLLGALSPAVAPEPDPAHQLVRDAAARQALRSWITAGLGPDDQATLGDRGHAAATNWCHRAVAAGAARTTGAVSADRTTPAAPAARTTGAASADRTTAGAPAAGTSATAPAADMTATVPVSR